MEDETLTDGEISDDAFELLLYNGDAKKGTNRPVKKVTRKLKKEMETNKQQTNKVPKNSVKLHHVVCSSF